MAVAACGSSGDDESPPAGGAGHPGSSGGAAGASAGHAGNTSSGAGGSGARANGGSGGTSGGGTSGGGTSGGGTSSGGTSSGGAPAGTTGGTGAANAGGSSSGATSGTGTSGSGAAGRAGRGGNGGSAGTSRGGSSGHGGTSSGAAGDGDPGTGGSAGATNGSDYDALVLSDGPVLYLAMNGAASEPDLTGNGHDGTYKGGAPSPAALPNGDDAADFDGVEQYLTVPSAAVLSIPTKHELTWEAWIRPDVLQFDNDTSGYVDWMGKCEEYAPTCEWEARMYSMTNSENRCNRLSAYAFNPGGDLGSGAFWQQTDCGVSIKANSWYHVVGEYTTLTQPSGCSDTATYPGSIDIWVNGVEWHQASHGDTGCMSQYQIVPTANDSPVNVGTMAHDAWFEGAIGKVAIYDKVLSGSAIESHYTAMTGQAPSGSCADTCSF